MGSEKTEKALQTLQKWRDDGLITEQTHEAYSTKALDLWLQRQSEGEGGDRGQAPDAAEGTLSGQGRGGSGQESDTLLGARATTSSAPRGSEGLAADRSGAGPKASEGPHDDDVGRRVEVWRLTKTIDAREVKEMFRGVGTVTEAVVNLYPTRWVGIPFEARATVTFADSSQAERAVRKMRHAIKQVKGIGIGIAPEKEVVPIVVNKRPERAAAEVGPSGEPSGTKRRGEDALDSDRETWGSWTPAPTPTEVPPAPDEEEEPRKRRALVSNKETVGPDAAEGTSSGRGREGSGQGSEAKTESMAGDQGPERAAAEVGPSASRGAKAAGTEGPGPSRTTPVQEQGDVHAETDMAGEGTSSGTKKFTADEVDELFWKEIGPFVESLENDSKNALAAFKKAREFDSKEGWRGILKREDFFTLLTCYKFLKSGGREEDLAPPSFFTHQDGTKFKDYKKAYLGLNDDNESRARNELIDHLGFEPKIWKDFTAKNGALSKNDLKQKLRKQTTAAEVVRAWAPSVKGFMALWTEIFKSAESSIIEEPQEPDPAETDLAGEGTSKGTKNFEDPDQLPTLAGACPSPE